VRQNQRIIAFDGRDPPLGWLLFAFDGDGDDEDDFVVGVAEETMMTDRPIASAQERHSCDLG